MGKATQKVKSEFCNVEALDIFIECLTKGRIKLNGKQYAITSIINTVTSDIEKIKNDIEWMLNNPTFYSFDFSKYDESYNELVINQILSKKTDWIKNNYLDVLVNFYKNRYPDFTLTAEDNTKSVTMYISSRDIYQYVTQLIANKVKTKFIEILNGDIYSEFVGNINYYSIELLYRLTNGEFINKPYAKEFIKVYMSIISLKTDTKIIETYSHYGIACSIDVDSGAPYLIDSSFNYKDETLFFKTDHTGETIGISFSQNEIKFIINEGLTDFTKRGMKELADRNYISELFTSGQYKIWSTKTTRDEINPDFLTCAIKELSKNKFLFITVKNWWRRRSHNDGDVILITSPDQCDIWENTVRTVDAKNIGNVLEMYEKESFARTDNVTVLEKVRNSKNECPLETNELKLLLKSNYIAVKLIDGSCGWVEYHNVDRKLFNTPQEEVIIYVYFGDGDSIMTYSSNIKEILHIQPRHQKP